MSELVPVRVRDCACPDTPHPDGDEVYLRPVMGLEGGLVASADMTDAREAVVLTGDAAADEKAIGRIVYRRFMVTFLRYGAVGWNLQGPDGPVPFDVEALLGDFALAVPVAEKANELYTDAILRPLGYRPSEPLKNGQTKPSTSKRARSTRSRPGSSSPNGSAGIASVPVP